MENKQVQENWDRMAQDFGATNDRKEWRVEAFFRIPDTPGEATSKEPCNAVMVTTWKTTTGLVCASAREVRIMGDAMLVDAIGGWQKVLVVEQAKATKGTIERIHRAGVTRLMEVRPELFYEPGEGLKDAQLADQAEARA